MHGLRGRAGGAAAHVGHAAVGLAAGVGVDLGRAHALGDALCLVLEVAGLVLEVAGLLPEFLDLLGVREGLGGLREGLGLVLERRGVGLERPRIGLDLEGALGDLVVDGLVGHAARAALDVLGLLLDHPGLDLDIFRPVRDLDQVGAEDRGGLGLVDLALHGLGLGLGVARVLEHVLGGVLGAGGLDGRGREGVGVVWLVRGQGGAPRGAERHRAEGARGRSGAAGHGARRSPGHEHQDDDRDDRQGHEDHEAVIFEKRGELHIS